MLPYNGDSNFDLVAILWIYLWLVGYIDNNWWLVSILVLKVLNCMFIQLALRDYYYIYQNNKFYFLKLFYRDNCYNTILKCVWNNKF